MMLHMNKTVASLAAGILLASILFLIFHFFICEDRKPSKAEKKFRIIHIMSYHTPWQWTDDQVKGFKSGLGDLNYEYKEYQMNSKAFSSKEDLLRHGKEAIELIESYKPDLIFSSDDFAQEYVIRHYVNKSLPVVFSGVNADPETYRFTGSSNVTGIIEEEHFVQSVKLLQEIIPSVKRIAVITDDDPAWSLVFERCKKKAAKQLPGVQFLSWNIIKTFREYKQTITDMQTKADALLIIAWFNFKDENGKNVPDIRVARWTAENSTLPDAALWVDRVTKGTLCSVYVSGFEQGLGAGKAAREILHDGVKPSDIRIEPSAKGMPVISLYRAKKLGLKINSSVILESRVIEKAEWEK